MGSYETCDDSDSVSDVSFFVENNSVGDSEHGCSGEDNVEKNEFGNFQDTWDWVECESTSCPGTVYFFNLRTQCSTWSRPVSRHVQLQHFRRKPRIYNNSFTCDLYNSSMIVSESEEDYFSPAITDQEQDEEKDNKKSEILSRLYHGVDMDNLSDVKKSDHSDESVCNFSDGSYHYKDIWYNSSIYQLGKHFLTTYMDGIKIFKRDEGFDSPIATTDFLEVEFHAADNSLEITERNGQPSSEDDDVSLISEKPIIFTTSSSEEDEIVKEKYFVPRLRKIKTKYLLRKMPPNRRIGGRKKKQTPLIGKKSRPTKIVCEMYGTKTINYDSIEAELPVGVKQSNLSDSSVTSSLWQAESVKPAVWDNFELPGINLGANNLSSESSSSACSTCSCCSMTSTSTTSSSDTDTFKGG